MKRPFSRAATTRSALEEKKGHSSLFCLKLKLTIEDFFHLRRIGKEIEEMLAYSSRLARYHSSPDAASLMMIMVGLPCEYGHTEMKFLPFFEYNNVRQINC